jgi:hypothetical protein
MNIFFPLNEASWHTFLRKVPPGVKIQSRYKGVYVNKDGRRVMFMVRYGGKRHMKFIGRFPLTKEGEEQARDAYNAYVATIPLAERSRHPGQVVKRKVTDQRSIELV